MNVSLPSGNNVRQIKILDRILQQSPRCLTPSIRIPDKLHPNNRQTRRLNNIVPQQTRCNIIHPLPQGMNIVVRQSRAHVLTQRPNNLPILARYSGRWDRGTGILRSTFEVDVCGRFFGVS